MLCTLHHLPNELLIQCISYLEDNPSYIGNLRLVDKTQYRFGQTEDGMNRVAEKSGILRAWKASQAAVGRAVTRSGVALRAVLSAVLGMLSKLPVLGAVVRSYESQYDRAGVAPPPKLSDTVKAFFQRWEIKFTPAYYEAHEDEKAAKRKAAAAPSAERSGAQ